MYTDVCHLPDFATDTSTLKNLHYKDRQLYCLPLSLPDKVLMDD